MISVEVLRENMKIINDLMPTVEQAAKNIDKAIKVLNRTDFSEPDPCKIQGYTAEEWEIIRAGKYLCEFSGSGNSSIGTLDYIKDNVYDEYPFQQVDGSDWTNCRPAQIKGVIRPWFGGECPVDADAVVFVKYNKSHNVIRAGHLKWGHKRDLGADQMQITAYIEV